MPAMNDLISRKVLLEEVDRKIKDTQIVNGFMCYFQSGMESVRRMISNAPSVDFEPEKYEHWIVKQHSRNPGDYTCFCSGCKTEGSLVWKRCPVCEAKMTKEVQE